MSVHVCVCVCTSHWTMPCTDLNYLCDEVVQLCISVCVGTCASVFTSPSITFHKQMNTNKSEISDKLEHLQRWKINIRYEKKTRKGTALIKI